MKTTQNNTNTLLPQDAEGIVVEGQPIVVNNIESLDGNIIEGLEAGQIVIKHTIQDGKDLYHTYMVSHRQATGICLTYVACGYIMKPVSRPMAP